MSNTIHDLVINIEYYVLVKNKLTIVSLLYDSKYSDKYLFSPSFDEEVLLKFRL